MQLDDRKAIKLLWIKLSMYYQIQLRDEVLEMYCDDLDGLSIEQINWAMRSYTRNPKNLRMPLPAQIRAIGKPPVDDDSLAREAAARISAAIVKYGYTNTKEAYGYIGELGWKVVEKQGGWVHLCESVTVSQIPFLQAQWRDLAKVQIQRSRAGTLDHAPALPKPENNISQLVNSLAEQKKLT